MKRPVMKILSALIILPILAVIIGLLGYNFVEIRPKIPEINTILQNASPQDRHPPSFIKALIDTTPNAKNFVINELLQKFYPSTSQGKSHIRQLLWQILLPLNLDKEQRYGLFATLSYTGLTDKQGRLLQGLNGFAMAKYGKLLDQLTPYQSATVVAITHSPTHLLKDEPLLNQRATWLLSQVQQP